MFYLKRLLRPLITKLDLAAYLLIITIVLLAYYQLKGNFFEQDEWHTFSRFITFPKEAGFVDFLKENTISPLAHFTPLSFLAKLIMYRHFGLDAFKYFVVSIILHGLVTCTIYKLIKTLYLNKVLALIGALFFAVNSSHHQAVSWLGTFEGSEGAVLFGVVSLALFLEYRKHEKTLLLLLSFFAIITALLFKETALTFLLVLTFLIIRSRTKPRILNYVGLVLVVAFYLFSRFSYLLFIGKPDSLVSNQGVSSLVYSIIYNSTTMPVKAFSQIILPMDLLVNLALHLTDILRGYLSQISNPRFSSSTFVYDLITIPFGLLIIYKLYKYLKLDSQRENVYLGILIIIFNSVPLLFLKRYLVFIDSRYLYPATVGISILLVSLIKSFWEKSSLKYPSNRKLINKCSVIAVICFIFLLQWVSLKSILNQLQVGAQLRKDILYKIQQLHPQLPQKVVFYVQSDNSYYGLPESIRIIPFQSGFGQTLLVWYYLSEQFPLEFYKNEFLWQITDQGYKEIEDRGFGYFYDFNQLSSMVKEKKVLPSNILAFDFDSSRKSFDEITEEVQGRLAGFLAIKKRVDPKKITASASLHTEEAYLVLDSDRTTFWDSRVAYEKPQFFQLDLGELKKISQIEIDSASDKNQNEVGYEVLVSKDSFNWEKVFRAKKYPPNKYGLTDIYFSPTLVRYVKINQIGSHRYASWVIYELNVYESTN